MTRLSTLPLADLDEIARVWHAALPRLPSTPSAEALLRRLTGDLAACHVEAVRERGGIVAFAAYDPDQRWLRQLFVDPARQGTGLGTQLLASVMQAMPQGRLRTDEDNHPARRFYLRRGLRVCRIGPHPVSGAPTVEFEWP